MLNNFGKCLEISNGEINAIITIDFGPRIIRYGFVDGENMLYEDINREISQDNISIAIGVQKNNNLKEQVNKILEQITEEQRSELMNLAVERSYISK